MSSKIFNTKLYFDKLKQLKLIGIICGIIALLFSAAPPIMKGAIKLDYSELSVQMGLQYELVAPSIAASISGLIPYVFVASILLVFSAFSFLNKRNGSDYYHSLPNTRLCTYLSIIAAVFTWLFATIMITIFATWGIYAVFGLAFNYHFIPFLLLGYCAACLLIVGVTLVAVSVSGTRFTNILLVFLLLFLPRLILLIFAGAITYVAEIVRFIDLGWFLNPTINIPFGLAFDSVRGFLPIAWTPTAPALLNPAAIIYTFVLGFVFLVLGGVCFQKRSSETAGNGIPNDTLRTIFRCAIPLPFLMLPVFLFLSWYKYPKLYSADLFGSLLFALIVIIIALGCYFLFEIISAKSGKKTIKTLPWFLLPVGISVALAFGATFYGNSLLNIKTKAEDIASIQIIGNTASGFGLGGIFEGVSFYDTYSSCLLNEIIYQDPEIIEIFCNNLNRTTENINNDNGSFGEGYIVNELCGVTFTTKSGKKFSRSFTLNGNEVKILLQCLSKYPAYQEKISLLPPDSEINYVFIEGLDVAQTKEVWESFKKEYASLKPAELDKLADYPYGLIENYGSFIDPSILGETGHIQSRVWVEILVTGFSGINNYFNYYAICDLTPKTLELYSQYLKDSNGKNFDLLFNNLTKNPTTDLIAEYYNFDFVKSNNEMINLSGQSLGDNIWEHTLTLNDENPVELSEDKAQAVFAIIKNSSTKPAKASGIACSLSIDGRNGLSEYKRVILIVSLSQEEYREISTIFEKYPKKDDRGLDPSATPQDDMKAYSG